jgi:RimJ/RimL family protein N-acetyltransferase
MQKLMSESDLAIVPSSGILLEALSTGCKIISGMTAENQKYVYSNYLKSSFFINGKDFSEEALKSAIKKSLEDSSQNTKTLDGKSGERLLKLFQQLILTNKIELKKAEEEDLKITYEWAADPVVRAHSFSRNKIIEEEHSNWFKNKIEDKNCLFLIAKLDGEEIGSIRFDVKDNEAIISYLIDPEYHGKGLGQAVLAKGLEVLQSEHEKNNFLFKKVIGYVIGENIPSVKAFERLGFIKHTEADRLKFEKEIQ